MAEIKKWEVMSTKDVSPSKWFPVFEDQVRLPNGKETEYFRSELGDVAMILAITREKQVIFVRQYKHGIKEVVLELPAGRLGNKTPEAGALAELEEETGVKDQKLEFLGEFVNSPSKDSAHTFIFFASEVEINGEQKLDETEDIETVLIPLNQLDQMISSGEIKASDTVASILLARIKKPEFFDKSA